MRHGITDLNVQNRYTGSIDIGINDLGRQQVLNMLYELNNTKINKIYSSPMKRAYQTAVIVANFLSVEVIVLDELKEYDFGILEGQKKINYKKKFFTNGEHIYNFRKRIKKLLKYKITDNSLVVAHSGTYKMFVEYLINKTPTFTIQNAKLVHFNRDFKYQWNLI